jgi:hypothetical protein
MKEEQKWWWAGSNVVVSHFIKPAPVTVLYRGENYSLVAVNGVQEPKPGSLGFNGVRGTNRPEIGEVMTWERFHQATTVAWVRNDDLKPAAEFLPKAKATPGKLYVGRFDQDARYVGLENGKLLRYDRGQNWEVPLSLAAHKEAA